MTDWVKLKRGNDWGADYFAIEPLRNGFADGTRGIRVKDGETVPVRWADGCETEDTIVLVPSTQQVAENHLVPSTVRSEIPHVCVSYHDIRMSVCIDQVEVPREWAIAHGAK